MNDVTEILESLVGFPSVCRTPNHAIVAYARDRLAGLGAAVTEIPGPEGDRSNLFATFGPRNVPGYVLSAHLDVVPVAQEGWTGDPFRLRRDGDRLVGRGAADMKGFVACALSAAAALPRRLSRPLHIALSYDEEVGCVGVRHMIARLPELCAPPLGCIVGEPTGLRPVLRHKGKAGGRVTVSGRSGHSSRPDLADNAIHLAAEVVLAIRARHDRFAAEGPFHGAFAPPASTLQVGVIGGGTSLNTVPDACRVDWEVRAVPGVEPLAVAAEIAAAVERILAPHRAAGREVGALCEVLSAYPALDLAAESELCGLVAGLSGRAVLEAVSYGTEAGLYQAAGVPSIVCGPGDIAQAHRPDESIAASELVEGRAMLLRLADALA